VTTTPPPSWDVGPSNFWLGVMVGLVVGALIVLLTR
jgi:hypothetical protein